MQINSFALDMGLRQEKVASFGIFYHEFQAWIFLLLLKTIIMIPNRFSCEGDI